MLPRVIRAGRGRVVAVVGGDHEQVVLAPGRQISGNRRSKRSRLSRYPWTSFRCPSSLSKSTRLAKIEPVGLFAHRRHDGVDAGIVRRRGHLARDATPSEQVRDLPDRDHRHTSVRQAVEQRWLGRRHRVVVPVRRAHVRARRPDKRPGDHAANAKAVDDDAVGGLAHPVQLGHWHDVLVRGNLEHAVGGGVNDGLAGGDVRVAEPLDDLGARRDLVAQGLPADFALEPFYHLERKALWKRRERPVEDDHPRSPNAR